MRRRSRQARWPPPRRSRSQRGAPGGRHASSSLILPEIPFGPGSRPALRTRPTTPRGAPTRPDPPPRAAPPRWPPHPGQTRAATRAQRSRSPAPGQPVAPQPWSLRSIPDPCLPHLPRRTPRFAMRTAETAASATAPVPRMVRPTARSLAPREASVASLASGSATPAAACEAPAISPTPSTASRATSAPHSSRGTSPATAGRSEDVLAGTSCSWSQVLAGPPGCAGSLARLELIGSGGSESIT